MVLKSLFCFQVNVAAPKMFAFDGLFTDEDVQSDVASSALMESIHGVVSGVDGCLFAFGHASLGKLSLLSYSNFECL